MSQVLIFSDPMGFELGLSKRLRWVSDHFPWAGRRQGALIVPLGIRWGRFGGSDIQRLGLGVLVWLGRCRVPLEAVDRGLV